MSAAEVPWGQYVYQQLKSNVTSKTAGMQALELAGEGGNGEGDVLHILDYTGASTLQCAYGCSTTVDAGASNSQARVYTTVLVRKVLRVVRERESSGGSECTRSLHK